MDQETLKMALMVLNMLLTAMLWLFSLADRKHRATTQSIKEVEQKLEERLSQNTDKIERKLLIKCERISKMESEMQVIPRREELVRLHTRIDEINETGKQTNLMLGELVGQVRQMNAQRRDG